MKAPRLLVPVGALVVMTGCPKKPTCAESTTIVPDSILLDVAHVVAEPGTTFLVGTDIFALQFVRSPAPPSLTVDIKGIGVAVTPGAAPGTALVTVPNTPGTGEIKAVVTRSFCDDPDVSMESRVTTVRVSETDPAKVVGDIVKAPYVPNNPPTALMLDGRIETDGLCVDDWTLAVVGTVDLEENFRTDPTDHSDPCVSEIALFSTGHEMQFHEEKSIPTPWTAAKDEQDLTAGAVGIEASSYAVFTRIGIPDGSATMQTFAKDQIDRAQHGIDRMRGGVGLIPGGAEDVLGGYAYAHGDKGTVSADICSDETALNALLPPAATVSSGDRMLYVVFVEELSEGKGLYCHPESHWDSRVILVSLKEFATTTIAHEIGHAFALNSRYVDIGFGHARSPEFTLQNVMWDQKSLAVRKARRLWAAGQLFQMNVHTSSWMLHLGVGTRPPRTCPLTRNQSSCPAHWEDLGEKGPY